MPPIEVDTWKVGAGGVWKGYLSESSNQLEATPSKSPVALHLLFCSFGLERVLCIRRFQNIYACIYQKGSCSHARTLHHLTSDPCLLRLHVARPDTEVNLWPSYVDQTVLPQSKNHWLQRQPVGVSVIHVVIVLLPDASGQIKAWSSLSSWPRSKFDHFFFFSFSLAGNWITTVNYDDF